jgi:putative flippase GtrA
LTGPERILRMLAVGGAATGIYALLTWTGVTIASAPAPLASFLAYLAASIFSYGAHRRFTFASSRPHSEALSRFSALSLAGYVAALVVPALVTETLGAPVSVSILITCTVIPAANYVALSRLVFRTRPPVTAAET